MVSKVSKRVANLPGFSIDRVAAATGDDPEVLRLENLDTDLPPPRAGIEATKAAVGLDETNSYLPFTGALELRTAVSEHLHRQSGHRYDPETEVVITSGGGNGMLDALFATVDPGDEVILTDPTYAGMICRVRLAGAIPKLFPFNLDGDGRLDLDALQASVSSRTRAMLILNPAFPSCLVLNQEEWEAISAICRERSIWLLYDARMERILFDGRPYIHPATFEGMRDHTITVGCVSQEQRMIGWRIGWAVGPPEMMSGIGQVHIYNGITPGGIAQAGAYAALTAPDEAEDLGRCVAEWQKRRDVMLEQLQGMPVVPAEGGWCMLMNVQKMGFSTASEVSRLLLEKGKVAATPMTHWGERNSEQFLRLVFSNEPVERLADLRERFDRALVG
jgi:aspartate/methionine/tyrosine aminotransferase